MLECHGWSILVEGRVHAASARTRVKVIELTPKGTPARALFAHGRPPEGLERLSPREQQTLVRILARLLE